MNVPAPQFPASQRTSYQFPVYKWIGWLAFSGFAIGLLVIYFIAGLFGWPPPILWASIVILFTMGALLLDRPKLLLFIMMVYFLAVPSNRLLGIVPIPLLGSMNKFFMLPLLVVIVMNWIQRRQVQQGIWFPISFLVLTGLSWYVNGKPSVVVTVQLTLIALRLYILWYYCRLTCTFENDQEMLRWVWAYIIYIAIQYLYNIVWHRGLWLRYHPDRSGGIFGPFASGAHLVGYMSVIALLLIVGLWMGRMKRAGGREKWSLILLAGIIAYNLIFMTDTKHALLLMPIAVIPFFFHASFTRWAKTGAIIGVVVFVLAASIYVQSAMGRRDFQRVWHSFLRSPKAEMMYALTVDFPYLVRYPLLGAGPGRFASAAAIEARTPLARRYIIPSMDENRRRGYFLVTGTVISASVVGNPVTDFTAVTSEYGWLGVFIFFSFWGWILYGVMRKAFQASSSALRAGIFMALGGCLIFMGMIMVLADILSVPAVVYPIWMLIGRTWDMTPETVKSAELPSLNEA